MVCYIDDAHNMMSYERLMFDYGVKPSSLYLNNLGKVIDLSVVLCLDMGSYLHNVCLGKIILMRGD